MSHSGFKVIDSDMHIIEPADLWQRYMDRKFATVRRWEYRAQSAQHRRNDSTGGRPIQHPEAQPHMDNWFRALSAST